MRFVPGIISAATKLCLLGVNPEEGVTEAGMHVKAGGPECLWAAGAAEEVQRRWRPANMRKFCQSVKRSEHHAPAALSVWLINSTRRRRSLNCDREETWFPRVAVRPASCPPPACTGTAAAVVTLVI